MGWIGFFKSFEFPFPNFPHAHFFTFFIPFYVSFDYIVMKVEVCAFVASVSTNFTEELQLPFLVSCE